MENKFNNGKIYKIVSDQIDKIYIGSTTKKLSERMTRHRIDFKKWQNGRFHYVTSFELIKLGDCKIILLEEYPCFSNENLRKREQYYIDLNKDVCVNKFKAFTTETEKLQYYEINKEKIALDKNQKIFCECGGKTNKSALARHKKSKKHLKFLISIQI
jgi:ribosomal protein S27AE